MGSEVIPVARVVDIIPNGVGHSSISVDLLKRDLPFVVALLPVHRDHRIQGRSI